MNASRYGPSGTESSSEAIQARIFRVHPREDKESQQQEAESGNHILGATRGLPSDHSGQKCILFRKRSIGKKPQ